MSTHGEERQGTARYLQALAQHWPFIIGSVALAATAAALYLATAEDRYQARADVLVTPVPADDATFVGLPVIRESGEGRSVLTAAHLVETPQVADAARTRLQAPPSRDELLDAISVAPQEQSNIVTITGEGGSAERAAAIANAFARALVAERTRVFQRELGDVIRRLSTRLASVPPSARDVGEGRALADRLGALRGLVSSRDPTLQVASPAVAPTEPSWPRPFLSIAVASFVGLVLGIGIAIALELVNPLVLRDEDVLELDVLLLGRVPRPTARDLQAQLVTGTLAPDAKDAYRRVRVNLSGALETRAAPSTILVTSAARGEGKTSAAVNLALVYVQAGLRVILVDADLRRGRLTRVFGAKAHRNGLREVLLEESTAEEALTPAQGHGNALQLVAGGPGEGYAVDLLQSPRIADVVEELQTQADVVIFDSPPITEVADALPLAASVAAVVLVVRFGRTRRDKLADALMLLRQLGVAPAGVVAVTRRRSRGPAARPRPGDTRAVEARPAVHEKSSSRVRSSSSSS